VFFSVSDPLFIWIRIGDPNPDPIRIRIQPDPDPIRIKGFDDQKLEKIVLNFLGSKTTVYLSLGSIKYLQDTEEASALKREHQALQNMKLLNFLLLCGSFLSS